MRTQRRPRTGLCVGLLCTLGLGADPAGARADPAFKDTVCHVATIQINKGPVEGQFKGVTTVTGLPADAKGATVAVTLTFEKKLAGAKDWVRVSEVKQTATASGTTVAFDTGPFTFTPAPVAGDQYRVKVAGEYRLAGARGETKAVAGGESDPITIRR